MQQKNAQRAGFTLIEALVVIGIMGLLTGFALTYNRSSERQIALIKDQAVVAGILRRAKSFSVEKLNIATPSGITACGFGVHFDSTTSTYILFQDAASPCKVNRVYNGNMQYDGPEEKVEEYSLDPRIKFNFSHKDEFDVAYPITGPVDVVFVPPDPVATSTYTLPFIAELETRTGTSIKATVDVSAGGQIGTR